MSDPPLYINNQSQPKGKRTPNNGVHEHRRLGWNWDWDRIGMNFSWI